MIFHVCQTGVTYIFRLASEPRSHELKDLKLSFYLRITASKTYWCYSVMYEAAWCLCRLFLHCVSRITALHTSLLQHKISIHDIVMTVQLNIYLCKYAHGHFFLISNHRSINSSSSSHWLCLVVAIKKISHKRKQNTPQCLFYLRGTKHEGAVTSY